MTTPSFDFDVAQDTVLVVEDEFAIRQVLSEHLTDEGYRVLEAANGAEALDVVGRDSVGVVLIDKNLPGEISGMEVLAAIPARSTYTKSLIVTGFPSTDSAIDALRLGAFDYVTKPFDIDELTEKVARARDDFGLELERDEQFNKHAMLFETVPGVVWFMTEHGIIKRINHAGAELLGYGPAELKGQPYEVLLPEGGADDARWVFGERRTGERARYGRTLELKTASGELRLFEIYSAGSYLPVQIDGEDVPRFCGTVGVAHDITEQVRLEEMLRRSQKLESLGRLARGVAHDFNQILSIVIGNVELALETLADPDAAERSLLEILTASDHAAQLVKQLLAFSRDEAIRLTTVDVGQTIRSTADLLGRVLGKKVTLEVSCDPAAGTVQADVAQLQQVLINLATNARDAMPKGGTLRLAATPVTLAVERVTVCSTIEPGDYVRIEVSDDGVGIPPEQRDQIFEPFFTTKDDERGSGLGLATVLGVVRQLGGHLDLESEVGQGTSFSIFLPRRDEA